MKRFCIVLLQIVVSAELTLQILGLTRPWWSSRAESPSADPGRVTILCLGDSHTFGAPLPAAESYPSQLQARLDAHAPGAYRVVNRGVPGMNSASIAARFEEDLDDYRPALVILWAGANDIWNEKQKRGSGFADEPGWLRRALLQIKLVRLVHFLRSDVATAGGGRAEQLAWQPGRSASFRLGDERIEFERFSPPTVPQERAGQQARRDLTQMLEQARARDVPVLLVTYPYDEFGYANDAARDVARAFDVGLVETMRDRLRARADGHGDPELIIMAAGPHPRRLLYGYIVDSMLPRVLERVDLK